MRIDGIAYLRDDLQGLSGSVMAKLKRSGVKTAPEVRPCC